MAQQVINIGAAADDNTGDLIRDAFSKANANFDELYAGIDLTKGLFKWGLGAYWSGKGYESFSLVDSDNDWGFIALGYSHGLAIKSGKLYSWGNNSLGRTGQGINTGYTYVPTQVGVATDWYMCSAGVNYSLAIRKTANGENWDYTLWVFGSGASYKLGNNSTSSLTVPTQVGSDTDWQWVSAGNDWSSAIKNGLLYTCGNNSGYMTGLNTNTSTTAVWTNYDAESTGWTKCYTGYAHGIGVRAGELWSWGSNTDGRTGQGTTSGQTQIPTKIGSATDWVIGNAGYRHSAAINSSGQLFMFGEGDNGRLGIGDTTDYSIPTQVGTDTDWETVKCNGVSYDTDLNEFTYAIKGKKLYATGLNTIGQCGQDISTSQFTTFQQIGSGANYIDVAAGSGFGMAIQQTEESTTTESPTTTIAPTTTEEITTTI